MKHQWRGGFCSPGWCAFLICGILVVPYGLKSGERKFTIAFWNAHNLFDPAKDPHTRDGDFTPRGKFHWDEAKLARKIELMAFVIRELDADVIGLAEVENRRVLAMLAQKSGYAYHYLIDRSDPRGIDTGMMSKFPLEQVRNIGPGRGYLHAKVLGLTIAFAHWKSKIGPTQKTSESRMRSAHEASALGSPLLMLGDFNEAPRESGRSYLVETLKMEELISRTDCRTFYGKSGGLCLDGAYLAKSPECAFGNVEAAVVRPASMGVDKRHKSAPDVDYSDHWPIRVNITFDCQVPPSKQ